MSAPRITLARMTHRNIEVGPSYLFAWRWKIRSPMQGNPIIM
ncbi:MAG: hypothetical protein ACK5O2_06625 [Microthrixaceae bacterium]